MATKKAAGGRAHQGTPRKGRRLGIKIFGGQNVSTGEIIARQRGSVYNPGKGTKKGRDFTIFSLKNGIVKFKKFEGKQYIEVV